MTSPPAGSNALTGPMRLRGVRVHNLKGVDLDLPRDELIVFTGVSGSGKSSLAFDTLYAEGQRRYVETFSPYARQFLETLDKPEADRIEGLPPAIAVAQRQGRRSSRSTVGSVTEVARLPRRALRTARPGDLHELRGGGQAGRRRLGHRGDRGAARGDPLPDRLPDGDPARLGPAGAGRRACARTASSASASATASRRSRMGRSPSRSGDGRRRDRRPARAGSGRSRPAGRLDRDGLRARPRPMPGDRRRSGLHLLSRLALRRLRDRPPRPRAPAVPRRTAPSAPARRARGSAG